MPSAWAALISIAAVALCIWQDGDNQCNDGDRYTSGKPQPYPFHRRFCGWNPRALQACSAASLVALGTLMGDAKHALLFVSLPGFWFCAVHLTCVDAVAMVLALGSALLWPEHPMVALPFAVASGFVHERGPVFAALYAGSPLLLLGLVGVGWWRRAASSDKDKLVGRGLVSSIWAHRPYTDWLDWKLNLLSLRGVPFFAAYCNLPVRAWLPLGVAWASRLVGTDGARFIWWGSPLLIRELPDVPWWLVLAHVVTFRRMIGVLIVLGASSVWRATPT
jgi:hypothetical protein